MKSLSPHQPHGIILVGIPGSGKTHFAEKFSDTFSAPYVSHDRIRDLVIDDAAAKKLLEGQIRELLKTKQSIIIEGFTHSRTERTELAKLLRDSHYTPLFVWVQTDPLTAKQRTQKQKSVSSEDYDAQLKRFSAPHMAEKAIVISGKHTYSSQAKIVLKKLSSPRAEISQHAIPPARAPKSSRSIIVR